MLVNIKENKKRIIEVLLIILIAVVPLIINSTYNLTENNKGDSIENVEYSEKFESFEYLKLIILECSSIFLVVYFLKNQNRKLKDIGFSFSVKDIFSSVLLFLICIIALAVFRFMAKYIYSFFNGTRDLSMVPEKIDNLKSKLTIFYVIFTIINPFFEESLVRAYLISETEYITKNKYFAIFFSVMIQVSYYLYQGIYVSLTKVLVFTIFSFYYVKYRKIIPIILAHLIINLLFLLQYLLHASQM